jgi:hypothetical protein
MVRKFRIGYFSTRSADLNREIYFLSSVSKAGWELWTVRFIFIFVSTENLTCTVLYTSKPAKCHSLQSQRLLR